MRQRKGSLLVVITFGVLMAIVVVSMMTLANSLYTESKDTSKIYGDLQSYRAATEMACYQYVTDLQSLTVTKDLDGDWISVSDQAVYSQALDAIKSSLASAEDLDSWNVTDITAALSGANISNPEVLTSLLAKLTGVRQEFSLKVPEPLTLNWDSEDLVYTKDHSKIPLDPITVEVVLSVKGETIAECFKVSGLYLDITTAKTDVGSGSKHSIVTMMLVEKESGVQITRDPIETA